MNRMTRMFTSLCLAAFALASIATPGHADMRFGGEVWGAWNSHSMDDWNKLIDDANSSGGNFDNINSGFSFGVGPTLLVSDKCRFGVHFERLIANKSEDSGVAVKPAANAIGASFDYLFPSGALEYGLGAAVDMMTLAGKVEQPTAPTENDVEGSGVGFQVRGTVNYALGAAVHAELGVGYRFADIKVDKIGGIDNDPSVSGLDTEDYSGVTVRIGLQIHQPKK